MELIRAERPPEGAIAILASDPHAFIVVTDHTDPFADDMAITAPVGDSFIPLPEMKPCVASHIHVAGPSGSGKSTFADMMAEMYKSVVGGRVIVVSADGDPDPNLTHVDTRVPIDESISQVNIKDMAGADGALVIFDDVEGLPKESASAFRAFEQAVKERGRKMGLHSISIYHRGAANKSTQASLNEATGYVVFPKKLSSNITYMLKTYADIPPEVVNLIGRGDWGRWLLIVPGCYMLGEKKAAIIDPTAIAAIAKAEKKRITQDATDAVAGRYAGRHPEVVRQGLGDAFSRLTFRSNADNGYR